MPLPLVGGGVQEVLNLVYRMMTVEGSRPNVILGIEEPETHLHPEATKLLLSFLKDEENGGQVWITTHSPFLLDRAPLTSVILVSKEGTFTKATKVTEDKEMTHALDEIGVRPSDLFYSDAVLLVEGDSDKEFYRRMAVRAGWNFVDRIGIIPTGGAQKTRHNLKMWTEIGKRADLPVYVILDGDAASETQEVVKEGVIPQRRITNLMQGSLEDQYPPDKLEKVLQELLQVSLKGQPIPDRGRSKLISSKLSSANIDRTDWRLRLAKAMASEMDPDEIPDNFRRLMLELKADLKG
jgi:predicted ATP-dependent endonuclease of OLD family